MPESKRSLAESLLALFAGRQRAAAIYGDLLELAAARPRTSFWISYFRTLMSLSWRPLAAFFTAAILLAILFDSQEFGLLLFAMTYPHLGSPLADVTLLLWFLVPFAAIRYGLRDWPVRLAFAAFVTSSSSFILAMWFPVPEVWMALVTLAPFCIAAATPRRRSLIPVAASCAVGAVLMESLDRIGYFNWAIPGLQRLSPVLPMLLIMLLVSVVFSRLHHRLSHRQLAGGVHA